MRKAQAFAVACSMGALVLTAALGAAANTAGPVEPAAEEEAREPSETVPMAEILVKDRRIRGRIVLETETSLRIDPPARSPVAYPLDSVQDIQRFTLPAHEYYEEVGDAWRDEAWEAQDPPEAFMRARRAYRKALERAPNAGDRERLRARLETIAAERDEWQQEALKEQQLRKAAHEADAARIEKELAQERLASVRRQEQVLEELKASLGQTEDRLRRLEYFAREVTREIEDLEKDIDRLYSRHRTYVRTTVFLDLKREHQEVEERLERLERALRSPE